MDDGQKPKPASRRARRKPNGGAPPRPPGAPPRPPGAPSTPANNSHVDAPAPSPCPVITAAAREQSPNSALFPAATNLGGMRRGPLLMLPEQIGGTVRTLYDLSRGRGVDVDLPEMAHLLCYGCSHGWVLAGNCLSGECFLLDPLSRARRDLPGIAAICIRTPHAALSSAPTEPGCVVAVAFPGTLILCRLGAPRWSVHRLKDYDHDAWLGDCAFCRGKLYIVCGGGAKLFVVEDAAATSPGGGGSDGTAAVRRVEMDATQLPPKAPGCRRLGFLVESEGEVLLVVATVAEGALWCGVFRADLERATWAAVEEGLGDRALFVGKGCSASVVAGGGGVRGGRVYISQPLMLAEEEDRLRAKTHGRWFWAEHVVGLGCPSMKRAPPLRHWDLCWDASYWLIPSNRPVPSSSSPRPPPPPWVQV